MSTTEFKQYLVPLYIAAAAAGVYFIRIHIILNGGGSTLTQACITDPATRLSSYALQHLPFTLPSSGVPLAIRLPKVVASGICTLSEFFLGALEPGTNAWRAALECIGSLAVPVAAGWLEASRPRRSVWVAYPVLWALAYQAIGGGIVLPLQMLAITLTADAPTRIRQGQIARADAEGVLLGVILGYIAPSVYLVLRPSPSISAAWQIFPVYISLIKSLYSSLRRLLTPQGAEKDGYWATQLTYALSGLPGLAAHLRVVASIISSPNFIGELKSLFLPSVFNPPVGQTSLNVAAWHLLKWDNALMFGSAVLTPLVGAWDLGKGFEPPTAIALVQGIPAFGPGLVMSVAWIWREKGLREMRSELDRLELQEKEKEKLLEVDGTAGGKSTALEGSDVGSGAETPLRRSKRNKRRAD